MKNYLTILILLLIAAGCSNYSSSINREPVAKAGEEYLYRDELPPLFNNGITMEDSISIVRNYINRWIKRQLILSRAEINLTEEYKSEIDQKIEETRENLLIYQYQQQMMLQRMDTTVTEEEIQSYYDENIQNFNLTYPLIKALFIKIPIEAPNIDKVRVWYRSYSQENLQNLESYCYQFADKFDDFGENWINTSHLLRVLPEDIGNTDRFLRNNSHFETSDSLYYYFVNIRDFRLRGAVAPIGYVANDIKNIILNNRKIVFLQILENGLYNEAIKDNSFKIY